MKQELLFVYGTLLDDATRQKVIGREVDSSPDVLPGFKEQAIEVNDQPYACAAESEGNTIHGIAFELSAEELAKVDAYETGSYDRQQAQLASGATAWVYTLPATE